MVLSARSLDNWAVQQHLMYLKLVGLDHLLQFVLLGLLLLQHLLLKIAMKATWLILAVQSIVILLCSFFSSNYGIHEMMVATVILNMYQRLNPLPTDRKVK